VWAAEEAVVSFFNIDLLFIISVGSLKTAGRQIVKQVMYLRFAARKVVKMLLDATLCVYLPIYVAR